MTHFLIIFLFVGSCAYGQSEDSRIDKLRQRAYEVNHFLRKKVACQIDSINVEFSELPSKIEVSNYFRYSRTGVEIEYYFEKDRLFLVSVRTFSPSSDHFWKENEYFIEGGKVFFENERFGQSAAAHGIATPLEALDDPYEYYGYNRRLNAEFFREYIFELFNKIKNHR